MGKYRVTYYKAWRIYRCIFTRKGGYSITSWFEEYQDYQHTGYADRVVAIVTCTKHITYTFLKLRHGKTRINSIHDEVLNITRHLTPPVIVWTWIPREEVETLLRA